MKPKFKFLSLFLILALLCIPVLASCGTSETDITIEEEITTDAEEITTAAEETDTTVADAEGDDTTPTVTEFTVTFTLDDHVTVTVYQTQADMTNGENGETTTTAYARDKTSGAILTDGEGQVNFLLTFDEGYELATISIDKEAGSGYTNLKGSADTEVANGYRITKITDDLTVTIVSRASTDRYAVNFVTDEHITVTVYNTKSDMKKATNGEANATVAYARDDNGDLLTDGEGQVNFVVVVDDGYEIDSITVTEWTCKNLKYPTETNVTNGYRVTKITSDTIVTIATKATA